ncbi:Glycosyltransferase family 92 protein, partial [Trichostrongylus colubriformis]
HISDCLYRNMGVSRFVAFQDLDEFLVPQNENSSSDPAPLLTAIKKLFVGNIASIRVPAQYMSIKDFGEMRTLRNTLRSRYLDVQLTKCIVRPEMIFEQVLVLYQLNSIQSEWLRFLMGCPIHFIGLFTLTKASSAEKFHGPGNI